MKKRVLFLVPFPIGEAPSQRFRFEQYFPILKKNNIDFQVEPFLSLKTWEILYKPRKFGLKILGVLQGFWRRILLLSQLKNFDFVFIHREAVPIGPPWFEFLIAKVYKKKIIYDFDDAIWMPNTSSTNKFFSVLKRFKNTINICHWAYKLSCGNDYLKQFASQFNSNAFYNPTTIDTENHHKVRKDSFNEIPVIGWTGTITTNQYIEDFVPILDKIIVQFPFKLLVISNVKPKIERPYFEFIKWKKETEIEDLLQFDIGIMPLKNDKWANGKCGFKALQYLSLGIPTVASNVGVNSKIVLNNINGYLCDNEKDWENNLCKLLSHKDLWKTFGEKGIEKVEQEYSVKSNTANFLALLT